MSEIRPIRITFAGRVEQPSVNREAYHAPEYLAILVSYPARDVTGKSPPARLRPVRYLARYFTGEADRVAERLGR